MIEGILLYLGLHGEWNVDAQGFKELVLDFFRKNNGAFARMKCRSQELFEVVLDNTAELKISFDEATSCWLEKPTGMTNVLVYLGYFLQGVNSRRITVEVSENKLSICVDKNELVPKVPYREMKSTHLIDKNFVMKTCRPGTKDACVMLLLEPDGFCCGKFSGRMCGVLLNKVLDGSLKATRIGSCKLDRKT